MNASRLLLLASILAGISQVLPMVGIGTIWTSSLLVTLNLVVCFLGYRTGQYRPFWLVWGIATLFVFVALGLSNPLSLLTAGLLVLGR
ncbi:MAG: hypothetical protein H2043_15600 [Rhizobiales bacterium]|jgi:lipopolysaccharide export LptBFGC system permease protein LptF|nr:hypothetical protein [Hyphomicrobiales bacterium]